MKRPPDFAPIIYNATISHQWNCSIIIYSTAYIVPYIVYYTQLEWPQLVSMKRCCTVTSLGYFLAQKCYLRKEPEILSVWGWIKIAWTSCPHFCYSFHSIWVVLRGMAQRLNLLVVPSTFHLEEGRPHPWHCINLCRNLYRKGDKKWSHRTTHLSPISSAVLTHTIQIRARPLEIRITSSLLLEAG